MIASYVGPDGQERAFDVPDLEDFRCLAQEAGCSVLLEHENGSALSFDAADEDASLLWTDPLHHVYCWQGPVEDAFEAVGSYLGSGWPRSERVHFVPHTEA